MPGEEVLKVRIPEYKFDELMKAISPDYAALTPGMQRKMVKNYIRDLILDNCGVDISAKIYGCSDPLFNPDMIDSLYSVAWIDNAGILWLDLRKKGMTEDEIAAESNRRGIETSKYKVHRFFKRCREVLGFGKGEGEDDNSPIEPGDTGGSD